MYFGVDTFSPTITKTGRLGLTVLFICHALDVFCVGAHGHIIFIYAWAHRSRSNFAFTQKHTFALYLFSHHTNTPHKTIFCTGNVYAYTFAIRRKRKQKIGLFCVHVRYPSFLTLQRTMFNPKIGAVSHVSCFLQASMRVDVCIDFNAESRKVKTLRVMCFWGEDIRSHYCKNGTFFRLWRNVSHGYERCVLSERFDIATDNAQHKNWHCVSEVLPFLHVRICVHVRYATSSKGVNR